MRQSRVRYATRFQVSDARAPTRSGSRRRSPGAPSTSRTASPAHGAWVASGRAPARPGPSPRRATAGEVAVTARPLPLVQPRVSCQREDGAAPSALRRAAPRIPEPSVRRPSRALEQQHVVAPGQCATGCGPQLRPTRRPGGPASIRLTAASAGDAGASPTHTRVGTHCIRYRLRHNSGPAPATVRRSTRNTVRVAISRPAAPRTR